MKPVEHKKGKVINTHLAIEEKGFIHRSISPG